MRSDARNLEVIVAGIRDHNARCPFGGVATAVLMSPYEVERLGWDDVVGVPVEAESSVGTGRFRIRCSAAGDHDGGVEEAATEREAVTA